ncbi:DUF6655 family protein [Stieleria varia]|uniref:Uncharacterized protein n=1 Tax=Stieleria varia TaxID=2528005 RepID=A0A5C6B084_9BACT|nr:DUF6655 family protein [Stieleria varia]TWU04981.1 hypothetical protein Pla52n_30260 [Stieleria varia]
MDHVLRAVATACVAWLLVSAVGCGTTRAKIATEQLVMSDAVDKNIQDLDFRPLSGRKVYLDTTYLRQVKGSGFVNAEYVTSGIRQQIVGAGCLIQDASQDADIIIEARIGALGADDHSVTLGIPDNSKLASAVSVLPNAPNLPAVPELAVAKRDVQEAASKIAVFAYDRETREPVWQSGVRHSVSTARDTWVMGIGPFQGGSIRDKTKLVGSKFAFGRRSERGSPTDIYERPPVDYTAETRFNQGHPVFAGDDASDGMIGTLPSPDEPPEAADAPEAQIAENDLGTKLSDVDVQ